MKLLIAVITCHTRREQADAQYHTWVKDAEDVRFFLGDGSSEDAKDVILPVNDSYQGLPAKTQAMTRWALDRGYDAVFKVDDDTYVVPERLYRAGFEAYDYVGNFRMRNGNYPADYASGYAYWLSSRAMHAIADAPLTEDTMEDRWVGNVLDNVVPRLRLLDEKRFACTSYSIAEAKYLWGSPVGRTHIALAEYAADRFPDLHYWYRRAHADVVPT